MLKNSNNFKVDKWVRNVKNSEKISLDYFCKSVENHTTSKSCDFVIWFYIDLMPSRL